MNEGLHFVPVRASTFAGEYDLLFLCLCLMTAFITGGIAGVILWFVVRYRRRTPDEFGAATASPLWVEITWSVIPLMICLGIFYWASKLYFKMSDPPADAMVVQVLAKQWMWKVQHPDGRKEINELHVPVGRAVKLQMTSQDVIHSFYIPAFRIKQDVLPGRYATEWFTATQIGEYELFCAEYCGTSHSRMRGRVVVMSTGDYERWAANAALDDRPEAAGGRLFAEYGCMACHGQQAPTLAGIYGRPQLMQDGTSVTVDDDYLRESILYPRAKIVAGFPPIMPSFDGQLSEEQLFQLIAYIRSLREPTGPAPVPQFVPPPGNPSQGGSP